MMEEQFNRLPMMCSVAAGRIGAHVEQTGRAGYEKVREFAEWLDETYAPGRRVKLELAKVKLMLGETALSFDAGLAIKVSLVRLQELTPQSGLDRSARALWRCPCYDSRAARSCTQDRAIVKSERSDDDHDQAEPSLRSDWGESTRCRMMLTLAASDPGKGVARDDDLVHGAA